VSPPIFIGPDLFNPPPHRGWITLTPSISIFGEYNDNLDTDTREIDDFSANIAPGLTLSMQRPEYRLLAGYNFTAEFYANETERNAVFKRQRFFADAFYRFSPRLTLTLTDRFVYDTDSGLVSVGGISSGAETSYRNNVTSGLRWLATPLTSLSLLASYTLFRSDDPDDEDSDVYRIAVGLGHQFTPRFTGTASLGVGYLDAEDEPTAVTYTPRIGFEYLFTPTLRGFVSGGASFVDREDVDKEITPAGTIGFDQAFKFGSLRAWYDRAVTAETVGIVDRQLAAASLRAVNLMRGLVLELTPRYTHAERVREGDDRVIESFTVNLRATYQIARTIALFAGYTFFHQTEDGVEDIDQNRVFLGLQFAYPINFD
jgi:hypothetical protein